MERQKGQKHSKFNTSIIHNIKQPLLFNILPAFIPQHCQILQTEGVISCKRTRADHANQCISVIPAYR